MHYKALAINARGQVTSYQQGDHITTNRTFIDTNGLLATVNTQTSADYNAGTNDHQALVASDNVIQNDSYIWDVHNIAGINSGGQTTSLTETFSYDALNRMVTSDLSGTGAEIYQLVGLSYVDYSYSANGNLTRRSDVGYLNYDHLTKSHAVTSVLYEGTPDIGDYTYDANGNMQTAPDGGSVDYTPFDKPKQITGADGTVTQLYFGPERQLIREEVSSGGQTITTLHFGNYEKIIDGASVTDRYSVTGHNGEVVAMIVDEATPTTHYLHHDHLGSIAAISDSNGYVLERFHYDAFGKQRLAINASVGGINQSLNTDITRKGYTGHIELQTDSLTYMNARVYDSSLGRFMSADTIVPDPFHSQDFNRYSYVRNNPLRYTDPTGHQLCGTENVEDNNFTFGLCIQDFYDYRDIGYDPRDELSGGPNGPGAPPNNGDPTLPAPDPVSSGDGNITAPAPDTPQVSGSSPRRSPITGSERNGDGTLAGVVGIVNSEVGIIVTGFIPGVDLVRAVYYDEGTVAIIAGVFSVIPGGGKFAGIGVKAAAGLFKKAKRFFGKEAADRAKQFHSVLDPRAQRTRTTAVTETKEGIDVISSSERRLTPAQRARLGKNEIEGVGVGHAEVTGVNAARNAGLTPTGTAASRPICSDCANFLKNQGVESLSRLK